MARPETPTPTALRVASMLRAHRERHGLSGSECAALLGASRQKFAQWEQGSEPSAVALAQIALLLRVRVESLICRQNTQVAKNLRKQA